MQKIFRYKLIIEYDGTNLVGWNKQRNGISLIDLLENASKKFCGVSPLMAIAGRTDSGVHAIANCVHIDLPKEFVCKNIKDGLNYYLKKSDLVIKDISQVNQDFHARFSCQARSYVYILKHCCERPILFRDNLLWTASKIDIVAMQGAANLLVGEHDFSTFRSAECQANSAIKILYAVSIIQKKNFIFVYFKAKSFVNKQIRSMLGTLLLVGTGKESVEDFKQRFKSKQRVMCGKVVPAKGLYFVQAYYPDVHCTDVHCTGTEAEKINHDKEVINKLFPDFTEHRA